MSLVLVITVATVALADAGYQYNAPNVLFNQPAPFQQGQGSQLHHTPLTNDPDKSLSHSISYKDYVYSNKNDVQQSNGHSHSGGYLSSNNQIAAPQSIYHSDAIFNNGFTPISAASNSANLYIGHVPVPDGYVNNNYVHTTANNNYNSGYPQSFSPIVKTNNDYSQTSTLTGSLNIAHIQSIPPLNSANLPLNIGYTQKILPTGGTSWNNNGYVQSSTSSANSAGYSSGQVKTTSASSDYNLNSGNSQNLQQTSTTGFGSGFAQTMQPSASYNLNAGNSQSLQQTSSTGFSSGFAQTAQASASYNLNAGNAHNLQQSSSAGFGNGFAQVSADYNLNNGNSQNLQQTSSSGFGDGFTQTVQTPGGYNVITGNSQNLHQSSGAPFSINSAQTSLLSTTSNSNVGYSNDIAPSGSGSISTGYTYSSTPSANPNLDSGYRLPLLTSSSANINSNYAQTSLSSSNINLAQSATATSNGGYVQTLTGSANSNSNTRFTQAGSSETQSASSTVSPAIFKHIYFHVPPPEVEEQRTVRPAPPPKKNYKILFIKVPSQESNLARLQQLAQTRNAAAAVEDKTLIYVLVKNPESPLQVEIPKRAPSKHEVFFVKYNGNPLDLAAQVNEELDKSGSVQSIVPLEPGLVNGQK